MAQVRIQDGLERLVEHFVQEDDVSVAKTLEVCKRLIERFILGGNSADDSEDDDQVVRDVEHVSELIKRRCYRFYQVANVVVIREKSSPEAALRYSNLYSRLQTQVCPMSRLTIARLVQQILHSNLSECSHKFNL